MKRFAFLCGLVSACVSRRAMAEPAIRVPTLNAELILQAIADVETRNDASKIGPCGERGRCQFLHTTWIRYTTARFDPRASEDSAFTRSIERLHLNHIIRCLFQPGQIPDPLLIAAAWHYGERGAVKHVRSDYAARVANTYWAYLERAR